MYVYIGMLQANIIKTNNIIPNSCPTLKCYLSRHISTQLQVLYWLLFWWELQNKWRPKTDRTAMVNKLQTIQQRTLNSSIHMETFSSNSSFYIKAMVAVGSTKWTNYTHACMLIMSWYYAIQFIQLNIRTTLSVFEGKHCELTKSSPILSNGSTVYLTSWIHWFGRLATN